MVREFLRYVHENRRSWRVLYRVAIGTAAFTSRVTDSRRRITEMVAELIRAGTTVQGASDLDFELTALAIVGATEAVADRIAEGDVDLDAATDLLVGIVWRGPSRASAPIAPPPEAIKIAVGPGSGTDHNIYRAGSHGLTTATPIGTKSSTLRGDGEPGTSAVAAIYASRSGRGSGGAEVLRDGRSPRSTGSVRFSNAPITRASNQRRSSFPWSSSRRSIRRMPSSISKTVIELRTARSRPTRHPTSRRSRLFVPVVCAVH